MNSLWMTIAWNLVGLTVPKPVFIVPSAIQTKDHQKTFISREIFPPEHSPNFLDKENECRSEFSNNYSDINKKQSKITDPAVLQLKFSRNSLPTPSKVKGIYLTGYSLSDKKKRTALFKLIKDTELNTVVIDFQDPDGNLMFPVRNRILQKIPLSEIALTREKFREILRDLQKNKIYTIARITTFQDEGAVRAFPELTLQSKWGGIWKNYKNLGWLDMTNAKAWEIPFKKAIEAAQIGFDEVQFDYIRFPTDGNLKWISYANLNNRKKYEVLSDFFKFLKDNQKDIGVPISADLFGITYEWYSSANFSRDLAIGQRLIDAVKYFDYLSPMIYPSHYASGYAGYKNPANFPYQVVNKALRNGHKMIKTHTKQSVSKSRPWLQAFNLGAVYDYHKIRAEIKAVNDNQASGWLLWNARNVYDQAFK